MCDECDTRVLLDQMNRGRLERVIAYLLVTVAGGAAIRFPSALVTEQVSYAVAIAWGVCMMISGGMCLWGSSTDKWIGEFAGIPLLAAVIALYSLSALISGFGEGSKALFAYGLVLMALPLFLRLRRREVNEIRQRAVELSEGDKET